MEQAPRFQDCMEDKKFRPRKYHQMDNRGCAPVKVPRPASESQTALAEATADGGVSVKTRAKPRRDAPEWVFNDKFLCQLTRKYARGDRAQKQVAILYLYYRCGMKQKDLAEEFGLTEGGVKKMIQRLALRAQKHYEKTFAQSNQELKEECVPYGAVRGKQMQKEVIVELEEAPNEAAA